MEPVELSDGRLRLRTWRESDVDAVHVACQDPEIQRWTQVPVPYTRVDAEAFVGRAATSWAGDEATFAVTDAADGTLLGSYGFSEPMVDRRAEVGFWTAPWARGRGVATDATRLVAEWAFRDLHVVRLQWQAIVGNWGSRRVAEKAGFTIEGTLRRGIQHRGADVDAWVAALLPGDGATDHPRRLPIPSAPVRLAAEGVVLRAYEERDVPAIIAMLEDAETKIWNPTKGPLDLAAAEMAADGAMWTGERHTPWAIADASDDRYLGGVVLHAIDHRQFDAEVGYTIVPRARGRGVASRAVRMAAEYGFDALGLVRIELLHAVGNVASCRVAERAGFVLEGTLRSAYIYGDGQRHDEHTHARLADDPDSSSAADLRGQ